MNRTATLTAIALALGASSANATTSGSDAALDALIGSMAARDTGSARFDHHVETVSQEVAFHGNTEPYGAAGPARSKASSAMSPASVRPIPAPASSTTTSMR